MKKQVFKNYFQFFRLVEDMSQQEAAFHLGIDRSYIPYIERGLMRPGKELVGRICALFRCGPDDIFPGLAVDSKQREQNRRDEDGQMG